ncbi:hypothetical protein QBC39DRAFT_403441 [Podospora conica]|nr:hypothetical protein QBC39DRAFT_403441 [Schizothecium conicum]
MSLDTLPAELLYIISESLDPNDARNLRLVCRHVYPVTSACAMRDVVFYPEGRDLQHLQEIARHPVYHKQVKSLIYVNVQPMSKKTAQSNSNGTSGFLHSFRAVEEHVHNTYYLNSPIPWDGRAVAGPDYAEEQCVLHWYDMLSRAWDEQDELFEQNRDYEAIKEAIGRLPNLSEVTVSSEDHLYQAKKTPFAHLPRAIPNLVYDMDLPTVREGACRNAWAIFAALHAAGTRLKALRLGMMPFEFLDHDGIGLGDLAHLFGGITEFKVCVQGLTDDVVPFHRDDVPDDEQVEDVVDKRLREFRRVAGNGVLGAAIASMTNLVELHLQLDEIGHVWHAYIRDTPEYSDIPPSPTTLDKLFTPGQAWLNLKSLFLQGVSTDRHQLVAFLENQPKLTSLVLVCIDIGTTSWQHLLPHMKEALPWTRTGTVEMSGHLTGRSEEDGEPDDVAAREVWKLQMPGSYWGPGPIAKAISEYFRTGEHVPCPFTREKNGVEDLYEYAYLPKYHKRREQKEDQLHREYVKRQLEECRSLIYTCPAPWEIGTQPA